MQVDVHNDCKKSSLKVLPFPSLPSLACCSRIVAFTAWPRLRRGTVFEFPSRNEVWEACRAESIDSDHRASLDFLRPILHCFCGGYQLSAPVLPDYLVATVLSWKRPGTVVAGSPFQSRLAQVKDCALPRNADTAMVGTLASSLVGHLHTVR